MSYQPKVYRMQGGDELVIADGGSLTVETGALVTMVDQVETKAANYTCVAADSGKVFVVGAADVVFTLPATVAGLRYRFVVSTLSTSTGCSISPNSADKIMGNGFTSDDDKDAINTAATDREGDMIEVVGDGNLGWYITEVIGTWARES